MNDKTYEDAGTLMRKREAYYLDYLERRHKRTYPELYWQPHHANDSPPDQSLSMVAAVERMSADRRQWQAVADREGCCGQREHQQLVNISWTDSEGVEHEELRTMKTDGFCWNIRGMCPRIEEAARVKAFCESVFQYLESLNYEVQEEACLPQ